MTGPDAHANPKPNPTPSPGPADPLAARRPRHG
jgi:hypothetical protein